MSEWVSVKERLPDPGTPIWAFFPNMNGGRKGKPVQEGDYARSEYNGRVGFLFGKYRNSLFEAPHCLSGGLTHWQLRRDHVPPAPLCQPARPAEPLAPGVNTAGPRKPYTYAPGKREAATKRMREYWRKRKAAEAGTDMMKE